MNTVDDEIRALAALALRNAFYEDYSALVNTYIKVATGLSDYFDQDLQSMSNVFSRDGSSDADVSINIYTENGNERCTSGWDNLLEALNHREATSIWVQGKKVFEQVDGKGWYYCAD